MTCYPVQNGHKYEKLLSYLIMLRFHVFGVSSKRKQQNSTGAQRATFFFRAVTAGLLSTQWECGTQVDKNGGGQTSILGVVAYKYFTAFPSFHSV